jgi:glutaminase
MNISRSVSPSRASQWAGTKPPLLRFLERCHAEFAGDTSGSVADYIPELGKADPDQFGISLATTDGHVYEVGDTRIPFTIQSMSKPFVFALALDTLGRAIRRSLQLDPAQFPEPSVQSDGQCRRDCLLRSYP